MSELNCSERSALSRRRGYAKFFRRIDGELHKLCCKCKKWKPLSEYYTRPSERKADKGLCVRFPRPECKICSNEESGRRYAPHVLQHGTVSISKIYPFVKELVDRIGLIETSRRTGIWPGTLHRYIYKKPMHMRKTNASVLLHCLQKVRENGEWRSPGEIHHGTPLRKNGRNVGNS